MSIQRRLLAAVVLSAMAFGNAAAAERKPRPTTLYLSTGTAEGGCTPTELTTRPSGGSNCGSLAPNGGSTTWISPGTDEGYPFNTVAGTVVEGQVSFGPDLVGYQAFTLEITVELNGLVVHEQSTTHDVGVAQDDVVVEFTFDLPADVDEIEAGKVTVAVNGISVRGSFIDGSGGSFLKFPPAEG